MQVSLHLVVLTTLFGWSSAFQSITVGKSYNITAGTEVPVKIINDDNDLRAVNYTVGLYTAAGNSLICKCLTLIAWNILTDKIQRQTRSISPHLHKRVYSHNTCFRRTLGFLLSPMDNIIHKRFQRVGHQLSISLLL